MKLLICSDGSEAAGRAIRLGATIAAACQAEVTLLGIAETPADVKSIEESLAGGRDLLLGKNIRAEISRQTGEPIAEIIRQTKTTEYDLVLIGGVRREASGEIALSSKKYNIIKSIRPPVLAVTGRVTTIKKILFCATGNRQLDHGLELTGRIAHALGASLTLLHVVPEPPALYVPADRREADVAAVPESDSALGRELRRQKELVARQGVATDIHIRGGLVVPEILNEIRLDGYDLVVTGSSLSHGALRTYVLGDITREIVNHVEGAVMVVRVAATSDDTPGTSLRSWLERVTLRTRD